MAILDKVYTKTAEIRQYFFFTSRRPHTRCGRDWSSDVCSSDLDALNHLVANKRLKKSPLKQMVAAISVGVFKGTPVADLDYPEDSEAETDMNVIMTDQGGFIEIQGTAEGAPFEQTELDAMLALARKAINQLFELQKEALKG